MPDLKLDPKPLSKVGQQIWALLVMSVYHEAVSDADWAHVIDILFRYGILSNEY